MHQPVPLLAVDWIQIAIFLFIIFSSLAGQLFKTNQERRQQPDRQPPRKPRPDPRPAGPQFGDRAERPRPKLDRPKPDRPRSPLQDEIETFVRRAMGQEPEQAEVVAEVVRPVEPKIPVSPPVSAWRTKKETPKESVAEHVARHIQHSDREASQGGLIGQADERMESHLERVFDHSLGQLGTRDVKKAGSDISQGTDASVWDPASRSRQLITARQIAEKLRSPDEIAAALVLGEILRRPTERWS